MPNATFVRPSRALVCFVALALLATGCGSVPFLESGGSRRRVLVDFRHDEFGASFLNYFPSTVKVRPGDTIEFRQLWSGEPHTVTMGSLVDILGKPYWEILDAIHRGEDVEIPKDLRAPGFLQLPVMLDREEFEEILPTAAQPCFLEEWVPDARDFDEPCPEGRQPAFTGRQAYYNSGLIPFDGPDRNEFTVPLAEDILPGTYHYYCNYHGPSMSGAIEVVDDDEDIPSQTEVNRSARDEAQRYIDELERVLDAQAAEQGAPLPSVGGRPVDKPLFTAFHHEFVPSTIRAEVGEKVTWSFYGGHTLSFNVPKYFPVFTVAEDGTVGFNPEAFESAGGWPARPEQDVRTAVAADAGEWDGSGGFKSTGWDYGGPYDGAFDTFSVTFTRAGDYPFACLLHPSMVGEVVVR